MFKEIIEEKPRKYMHSGKFHISSIGQCKRKIYLKLKGIYKDDFDPKTLRTFGIGNLIHQQIIKELFQKTEQVNWRILTGEIDIPPHRYIVGRCDLIMVNSKTEEKVIIDIKSISPWSFGKIEKAEYQYIKNYNNQIQLYLHFFKIEKGVLLFVNKASSEIKEIEIKYDKELCLKLIKEIEDFFKDYVEKDIAPNPCDGGDFGCDACGVAKNEK